MDNFGDWANVSVQQVLLSYGASSSSAWDPSKKGTNVTLSGGNLIATTTNAGRTAGTASRHSGTYQYEVTIGGSGQPGVGIIRSAFAGGWSVPVHDGSDAICYYGFGRLYRFGSDVAAMTTYTAGDVIGVVGNWGASELRFYKNGVNIGGVSYSSLSGAWFPMFGVNSGAAVGTLNVGATAFAYAIGGATAWG